MLDALGSVSKSHTLYWIVAIGGLAGNTTVMLTSLLGQVRIFYVMARDRMLPPGVARIHHVFRTPARMTLITGAIVAIFAAVLPLTELLTLVNIGTLAAFAIVCAGVLVLRIVNPAAQRPFRAPLLPLFSIAGAASCLYLVTGLRVCDLGALRRLVRGRDLRLRPLRVLELAAAAAAHRALTPAADATSRLSSGYKGAYPGKGALVTIQTAVSDRFELVTVPRAKGVPSFAADVAAGLSATPKRLPSKYLYDEIGSALFDAITRLPEYYLTQAETEILSEWGWQIVRLLDAPLDFLELGSGSAIKTRLLIGEALRVQDDLLYSPIDISTEAVSASSLALVETYLQAARARVRRRLLRRTRIAPAPLGPQDARNVHGIERRKLRARRDAALAGTARLDAASRRRVAHGRRSQEGCCDARACIRRSRRRDGGVRSQPSRSRSIASWARTSIPASSLTSRNTTRRGARSIPSLKRASVWLSESRPRRCNAPSRRANVFARNPPTSSTTTTRSRSLPVRVFAPSRSGTMKRSASASIFSFELSPSRGSTGRFLEVAREVSLMIRRLLIFATAFACVAGCRGASGPSAIPAGPAGLAQPPGPGSPDYNVNELPEPPVVKAVNGVAKVPADRQHQSGDRTSGLSVRRDTRRRADDRSRSPVKRSR